MTSEEATSEPMAPRSTTLPAGFWRDTSRPLALFAMSKFAVLLVMGATAVATRLPVMAQMTGWDSRWYLTIARTGYVHSIPPHSVNAGQSDLGFFPLIPLIIRLVHAVTGFGWNVSGEIAVTALAAAAAVALWWTIREVFGVRAADRGTLLVFLSPAAFVLSMMYSEGAIILFVSGTLFLLRRQKWILAGLCAAAATAADPVGCAAIVPCVVAAVTAIRSQGDRRSLWAPALAPGGVGAFFVYLWIHTGSPLEWFEAQRSGWQHGDFGGGVPVALYRFVDRGFHDLNYSIKSLSFLLAIVLLVAFLRSHPPAPWVGYVVAVLVFGLASPIIGVTPRLLLRNFPLLAVMGARLPTFWFELALGFSALLLATLTIAASSPLWTP